MQLRQWQAEAIPRAVKCARDGQRGLISAVMGSGKSIVIKELLEDLNSGLKQGFRNIVTVPTIRLVEQLSETLGAVGTYYTHGHDLSPKTIVACLPSVPKLAEEMKGHELECAVWIADEAHRTNADNITLAAEVLDPYAIVGFTATPFLSDKSQKLRHFDRLLYEYPAAAAIADGVIVEPEIRHYNGKAKTVDQAVFEMIRKTEGPGICNAETIEDAEAYARFLTNKGIFAQPIHSEMSADERDAALQELYRGNIRCLVHVRLLSEGVDLPWLRWLAMRRLTGSRVSFCQEVGRILRSFPGKETAVLLDPHDLFNEFNLTNEAMLGCEPEYAETHEDRARAVYETQCEYIKGDEIPEPMILIDAVTSYLRRLCLALAHKGLIDRKIKSRTWRLEWPTDAQQKTVSRLEWVAQRAPEPHQSALYIAFEKVGEFSRGTVSDLISILMVAANLKRWPEVTYDT